MMMLKTDHFHDAAVHNETGADYAMTRIKLRDYYNVLPSMYSSCTILRKYLAHSYGRMFTSVHRLRLMQYQKEYFVCTISCRKCLLYPWTRIK